MTRIEPLPSPPPAPDKSHVVSSSRPGQPLASLRLPGLDGLRAVAVLIVIVCHVQMRQPLTPWPHLNAILVQGMFGVEIFFVISGLLITWLLLREEAAHGSISFKLFYLRRAARILPPALGYLLIVFLITAALGRFEGRSWTAAATFWSNLLPNDPGRPAMIEVGHFWSLSIEEQYYLFWPLLFVLLGRRWRLPILIIALVALPIWRQLNFEMYPLSQLNPVRTDFRLDGIIAGSALAVALDDTRWRRNLGTRFLRNDLVCLVVAAGAIVTLLPEAIQFPGGMAFGISFRAMPSRSSSITSCVMRPVLGRRCCDYWISGRWSGLAECPSASICGSNCSCCPTLRSIRAV